ncbi:MAG TPA: AmmeMemoRadiSam system radical SAM enzyme [bacterium]|nr:AmmeMemoRadiSam system radical SAM enzyme [bacterium]
MAAPLTLEQTLSARSVKGLLYEKLSGNGVHCFACAHRCRIPEGKRGICKVRYNEKGRLMVPWNYVSGRMAEAVEKKPFFHALPGSLAFSFGMLGCDYHCDYCQNWITSQALRDPAAEEAGAHPLDTTAPELVKMAIEHHCRIMTSTYNEPLITSEWAVEIFKLARSKGLLTSYVSNGNATVEVLEFLRPWVDLYKVDLKSFNDQTYRHRLGGTLAPVLETIERLKSMGFWVEVVTLLVPGLNDSEDELRGIARFLASVSRDIPWHVTAFHPDYHMEDGRWTEPEELERAYHIGRSAGLHYVYSGNRPGEVGSTENTYCPHCDSLLIEREGTRVLENRLEAGGHCHSCGASIPGVWEIPPRGPNPAARAGETPKAREALLRTMEPGEALLGES